MPGGWRRAAQKQNQEGQQENRRAKAKVMQSPTPVTPEESENERKAAPSCVYQNRENYRLEHMDYRGPKYEAACYYEDLAQDNALFDESSTALKCTEKEMADCKLLISNYKLGVMQVLDKLCACGKDEAPNQQKIDQMIKKIVVEKIQTPEKAEKCLKYLYQHYITLRDCHKSTVVNDLRNFKRMQDYYCGLKREFANAEALLKYAEEVVKLSNENHSEQDVKETVESLDSREKKFKFLAYCRRFGINENDGNTKYEIAMKRRDCLVKAHVLIRVMGAVDKMEMFVFKHIFGKNAKLPKYPSGDEMTHLPEMVHAKIAQYPDEERRHFKDKWQEIKEYIWNFDLPGYSKKCAALRRVRNYLVHPPYARYESLLTALKALMKWETNRSMGSQLRTAIEIHLQFQRGREGTATYTPYHILYEELDYDLLEPEERRQNSEGLNAWITKWKNITEAA